MKKIILGTAMALILLSACKNGILSKKSTEIINFEISQNSETVPAIIRIDYSIEQQNECADYSLKYNGADSIRSAIYDENNPNAIDEMLYYESSGETGDQEMCTSGDALTLRYVYDLQYLNAGNYEISITLNGETETKTFSLSASKNN